MPVTNNFRYREQRGELIAPPVRSRRHPPTPGPGHLTQQRNRGPELLEHLRRTSRVTRLDAHPNATQLIAQAASVTAIVLGLPEGRRYDRRLLVPSDPHALDDGTPLSRLVLSLLTATGTITVNRRTTTRTAWAQAGVDCDEIIGGLTVLGIQPLGWTLPSAAPCTLPPRQLQAARWPTAPSGDAWVFVTENPSIIAAAADLVARDAERDAVVRLICTMGNPSGLEISAITALADAGWNLAIRADFDATGIRNVTALLAAAPTARPWRMTTRDYLDSAPAAPAKEPVPATPWDPDLAPTINATSQTAFEEALLPNILWSRFSRHCLKICTP